MFVAFSNIFSDWVKKESPSNFVNGGKKKKKVWSSELHMVATLTKALLAAYGQ